MVKLASESATKIAAASAKSHKVSLMRLTTCEGRGALPSFFTTPLGLRGGLSAAALAFIGLLLVRLLRWGDLLAIVFGIRRPSEKHGRRG